MLPRFALRCGSASTPAACVAQAEAAERAGFSTVWFAENPFQRGAWPALSAAAVATRRIRLGVGVFNPYTRHPSLIAMEMAAFDELSGGRAILGIGSGMANRLARLGLANDRRIAAARDTLAIVRGLLRGEEVRHSGKVFSADGVKLEFAPRRSDLPILLAAMGEHSQRLCAEMADGLILSNLCPPGYTRRATDLVRDAAASAGRAAPREVVQYVPCAVRADGAEARRLARATVASMLTAYWSRQSAAPATRAAIADYSGLAPGEFARLMARLDQGESPDRVLDDRLLAEYAITGTVDECLERCRVYAEAGVTELAVWFIGDRALEDIARLGEAYR